MQSTYDRLSRPTNLRRAIEVLDICAQLATVGDRILAQRKKLELSARAASFRGSSPTGPRLAAQNSIADIYEIRKT